MRTVICRPYLEMICQNIKGTDNAGDSSIHFRYGRELYQLVPIWTGKFRISYSMVDDIYTIGSMLRGGIVNQASINKIKSCMDNIKTLSDAFRLLSEQNASLENKISILGRDKMPADQAKMSDDLYLCFADLKAASEKNLVEMVTEMNVARAKR